jgi:radical SAM protein with 4Fe4S-binding SPASM domain
LHRRFLELLAITKRYEIPSVYITTNGLLLNPDLIDKIVRFHYLTWITVSIDAATRSTYERIRVGGSFDKLIANVREINRAKQRSGSDEPLIGLNFVLMRSNIRELPAVVRLAHELQADSVCAYHMVPFHIGDGDTREESLEQDKALCNRMLDEARAEAGKLELQIILPDRFEEAPATSVFTRTNYPAFGLNAREEDFARSWCQFPWHYLGIDPHGYVNPCGWWYSEPPMGNIQTESFEEIWNNEHYRALRAEHLCGGLRATCQACPANGLGNVNNKNAFLVRRPVGPAFLGDL